MKAQDFEKEILALQDKVFRFAKRILKFSIEAEDISQEVFLKLWKKRSTLGKYKSIEALAMTMTKNSCFDQLKSSKRKTVELTQDTIVSHHSPLQHTELADSMELVNRIIDRLPEQQRMIVQLRDIEGYDFQEITAIMDISTNTARVTLSRARKSIKEQLTKAFDYELKTD